MYSTANVQKVRFFLAYSEIKEVLKRTKPNIQTKRPKKNLCSEKPEIEPKISLIYPNTGDPSTQ